MQFWDSPPPLGAFPLTLHRRPAAKSAGQICGDTLPSVPHGEARPRRCPVVAPLPICRGHAPCHFGTAPRHWGHFPHTSRGSRRLQSAGSSAGSPDHTTATPGAPQSTASHHRVTTQSPDTTHSKWVARGSLAWAWRALPPSVKAAHPWVTLLMTEREQPARCSNLSPKVGVQLFRASVTLWSLGSVTTSAGAVQI